MYKIHETDFSINIMDIFADPLLQVENSVLQKEEIVSANNQLKDAANRLMIMINDTLDVKEGYEEDIQKLRQALKRVRIFTRISNRKDKSFLRKSSV